MTFKRQIPVEIHTPGSIERILTMVFDHWIGHMGSDIMKTIMKKLLKCVDAFMMIS